MSFRALRRAILRANNSLLALEESRAEVLAAIGMQLARGERVTDEALAASCCGDDKVAEEIKKQAEILAKPTFVQSPRGGMVALVSFRGLVNYDIEFQPYAVSTKLFARTMRELGADENVKSIVVVFDSPGGTVTGTPEAADAMYAARETKKVTAVVDTMAASAAYWVASQASEIVSLPSAEGVGSIGVRMMHVDCSVAFETSGFMVTEIFSGEFKTEGSPFKPLSDEAKARYQMESDTIYADFLKAVARGRGVSVADVREKYGKGRLLMPAEAKKLNMLDRLEQTDDSFRRLGLLAGAAESRRTEVKPIEFCCIGRDTYVCADWPEVTDISVDCWTGSEAVKIEGDEITIHAANGTATYQIEDSDGRVAKCRKISGTFDPKALANARAIADANPGTDISEIDVAALEKLRLEVDIVELA